eukprot:9747002-Alexandrium_andersonii.AAC.1
MDPEKASNNSLGITLALAAAESAFDPLGCEFSEEPPPDQPQHEEGQPSEPARGGGGRRGRGAAKAKAAGRGGGSCLLYTSPSPRD